MKVLVTGATGSQAKPVVFQLLEKGYEVVAFTRDKEKASDLATAGATIFEGNLADQEDVKKAMQQVDTLALHLPFFMPDPSKAAQSIVEAAKTAKINYIVWNTAGAIFAHKTGNPAYDVRLAVQDLLMESGIRHTILQPTVYAENLLGPWTAPQVKKENRVAYPVPKDFQIGWLPTADMAKAMIAALEKPALAGSNFIISGKNTLDGIQLAQAFSQGLERKIEYYAMPPRDFGHILDTVIGSGAGDAVAAEYQAIWDGQVKPQMYVDMTETLDKLGVEFSDLKDWVKQFQFLFS
ncbi:MAG: NmrA family NAD(P)-binding protein [Saprospiraceae bacterium]|nr:NmrA family NAD(P)-binding protein [Saprospiraceae bacterium]